MQHRIARFAEFSARPKSDALACSLHATCSVVCCEPYGACYHSWRPMQCVASLSPSAVLTDLGRCGCCGHLLRGICDQARAAGAGAPIVSTVLVLQHSAALTGTHSGAHSGTVLSLVLKSAVALTVAVTSGAHTLARTLLCRRSRSRGSRCAQMSRRRSKVRTVPAAQRCTHTSAYLTLLARQRCSLPSEFAAQ
jgi:hypothetical protein